VKAAVLAEKWAHQYWIWGKGQLSVRVWIPFPKSYSKAKRHQLLNEPHRKKPDVDNYLKGIMDTIFPDDDSFIWRATIEKRWEDAHGPRIELTYSPREEEP
jgi:Holliday junction resolvase RusA-like endonuclease